MINLLTLLYWLWLFIVDQNEKADPEKVRKDREDLERRQKEGLLLPEKSSCMHKQDKMPSYFCIL